VFHLRLMTHCMILIHDPEILRCVLTDVGNFSKNNNVINRRFGQKRVIGDHSFLSARGGAVWSHKRKTMSRFLNPLNIAKYYDNVRDATDMLLVDLNEKATGKDIVDLNDISGTVVTSIIGSLGLDNGIEMISQDAREIAQAIHVMMTEMNSAFFTPFYHKTPGLWKQHKKLVSEKIDYLRRKCADVLNTRREQMKRGCASEEDIIAHIIKMNEEQFPGQDMYIIDDIMTVFLASENSPRTIVMCLAFLARNPRQLSRLMEEIDEVMKDKRVPDIEDLDKLKYTEMVILETLRLYPAVSRGTRYCNEERTFKGYRLPEKSIQVYFYEMLHKSEKYWKDPEEFRPLRFSSAKHRTPYTYMAFAAGPRSCLGRPLALMQMKTILATLMYHYKFNPLPGEEEIKIMQSYVLLKLSQGFKCTVEHRVRPDVKAELLRTFSRHELTTAFDPTPPGSPCVSRTPSPPQSPLVQRRDIVTEDAQMKILEGLVQ